MTLYGGAVLLALMAAVQLRSRRAKGVISAAS
jgi:hypothetical protein